MLVSGIPVAFGLGAIAIVFLVIFQGFDGLHVVAETFWSGLDDFTLVAIPMFVMMGAAIGSSPAGKDLYEALDRWLYRLPGGLVISNLGACAIFAALTGSSPACCAAIGKMGIPEMRRRGYPDDVATGSICAGGTLGILIPPSITFILYGIATETSIGRLFLAGVHAGADAHRPVHALDGVHHLEARLPLARRWTSATRWKEKFPSIPKIAPFLVIIVGVMYALYGGVATPSEAAGVGAALCVLLAVVIYRLVEAATDGGTSCATPRAKSVMILTIIATAVLFGYMLTSLYLTQTLAQAIADMHVNRWVLMVLINLFLLVCGFFIPPAAIILMTSPILLPIITAAGFDPVWFGVILTINMEIGLIHPPVGLNIYIVSAIAPDVPVTQVMWGTIPYVICMMLAIVILCIFPEIATWLPDHLMGAMGTSRLPAMILLSNGGTNIQRAQAASDTILVGTVDGVALLGTIRARLDGQASRLAGRVRLRRHRARGRHAVRLDARRRHGAQRRRRHEVDLGQRGPRASRILVDARRPPAGPRGGVRRRAAGASLCQRGQGHSPGASLRRFATRNRFRTGASRRRRASATSRTSCSTATGCGSASKSVRCRCRTISARASPSCRSIPTRASATSTASWCIRRGPAASSSPTASSA